MTYTKIKFEQLTQDVHLNSPQLNEKSFDIKTKMVRQIQYKYLPSFLIFISLILDLFNELANGLC